MPNSILRFNASGVTSAHRSLRHLKRKDMHQLAESMISRQATQIGEMQRLSD